MKVLFLDIDGVLNSTRSILSGAATKMPMSRLQHDAFSLLEAKFGIKSDTIPYGPLEGIKTIDPVAVHLVNRLLTKDSDLYVVLSSSHRAFFSGLNYCDIEFRSDEHLRYLKLYFDALGLISNRLIDVTPRLYCRRGIEVHDWLEDHADEITHHCAIDDGEDFKPEDCNLVRTSAAEGISSKDYYKLTEFLNIDESQIILALE